MYVALCMYYMHVIELWTTTDKHTMIYHISCHRLPWYTMLGSLVNGVVFMLCEWIPDVNSRRDFSMYVAAFIGSYMDHVKLCTKTNTYCNFFPIYETHVYNSKQYCWPWSMVYCACAMNTFPFYICIINCVRMWLYTYAHLWNHNNFALCTNADAMVTSRLITVPADI